MIHIDEAVVSLLSAAPEVAIVVSHRIYATQAPQGRPLPAVVYSRETNSRDEFLSLDNTAAFARATYSVSALAETFSESRNLARAIRRALEYKQTADIRLVRVTDESDTIEPPPAGDQMPVYRTDLTIEVTHIEP
jgi:hypothetical protein